MRKRSFLFGILLYFIVYGNAPTAVAQQSNEPAKIELGGQFSSLITQDFPLSGLIDHARSEAGVGARLTYNLNKHIAFEAEGNFFPVTAFADLNSDDAIIQGQFGVKAGKRFKKFGVFAKARPGFVSFGEVPTQTGTETIDINGQPVVFPIIEFQRRNFFSMDLGAVLEFYPSRRILVRFDAGDTMIHLGEPPLNLFSGTTGSARTAHNFQVSSGVAVRFLNPEVTQDTDSSRTDGTRKFEAGVQFSSLILKVFSQSQLPALGFEGTDTQSGFGGRLTYNFSRSVGIEAQGNFFPSDVPIFSNGRGGGRMLQLQAGAKVGRRFEKFGLFGKVRPGAVSFSKTIRYVFDPFPVNPSFHIERRTHFSLDLGGVLEFYPSPRIAVRFDGGDTMIRYGDTQVPFNSARTPITHIAAETRHQFQFSTGVGFRF